MSLVSLVTPGSGQFAQLDKNKDQKLSKQEWAQAQVFDAHPTHRFFHSLFDEADMRGNKDGFVQQKEAKEKYNEKDLHKKNVIKEWWSKNMWWVVLVCVLGTVAVIGVIALVLFLLKRAEREGLKNSVENWHGMATYRLQNGKCVMYGENGKVLKTGLTPKQCLRCTGKPYTCCREFVIPKERRGEI